MTSATYGAASAPIREAWLVIAAVAALTAIRLCLAAHLELHFDEAYYWYWSKNLQFAYYDHPPAVAWLIHAGTSLFGDSELGVRLPGQLCVLFSTCFLFDAARRAFSFNTALISAAAAQATLLLGAGSVIMTPDAPLLLFASIALWALIRFSLEPSGWWWLVAGLAGGGALLSKHTAVLFAGAVGLWMLSSPRLRSWLGRPWPWAGAIVAILCVLPVLSSNGGSFGKQGERLMQAEGPAIERIVDYVGGQMLVITPGLFVLLLMAVWIMARRRFRSADPTETLLILWFVVPALFFLLVSPFVKIQANWLAAAWPAAFLLLARLLQLSSDWPGLRRAFAGSLAAGAVMVALVWSYAFAPVGPCFKGDPLAQLSGQHAFANEIAVLARGNGSHQIISDDYATASLLRFYAPADMQVAHFTNTPRYRGFRPEPIVLPAIVVARQWRVPKGIDEAFAIKAPSVEVRREHKGCTSRTYFAFIAG
jgi:4-amino-4-deoxy-L-arabinose transferase-like glycosyltransferase